MLHFLGDPEVAPSRAFRQKSGWTTTKQTRRVSTPSVQARSECARPPSTPGTGGDGPTRPRANRVTVPQIAKFATYGARLPGGTSIRLMPATGDEQLPGRLRPQLRCHPSHHWHQQHRRGGVYMVTFDVTSSVNNLTLRSALYFFSRGGVTWQFECESQAKRPTIDPACNEALTTFAIAS